MLREAYANPTPEVAVQLEALLLDSIEKVCFPLFFLEGGGKGRGEPRANNFLAGLSSAFGSCTV